MKELIRAMRLILSFVLLGMVFFGAFSGGTKIQIEEVHLLGGCAGFFIGLYIAYWKGNRREYIDADSKKSVNNKSE